MKPGVGPGRAGCCLQAPGRTRHGERTTARAPAWRAACLFTGRGSADERGDVAGHLPELRRAARLPHLGFSALVVLPCHHRVAVVHPAVRRGPVPPVAEDRLLSAIQADLAASPFHGEGHRKVWARLRYGLGLVVGRNRVLRLMHENQPLSPNRHPPRPANGHDGTILTTAPDRLWGTDASMVQTVADGRVRVFAALDHFNSEVIGHYVSTDGSRFAALEPISQAVSARFRGIEADVARGVTVRADHGPQYISGHFTHQIAHWGMALSHSFPEPQTNGVVERFRTLKEQVVYGGRCQSGGSHIHHTLYCLLAPRLARLHEPARLPAAARGYTALADGPMSDPFDRNATDPALPTCSNTKPARAGLVRQGTKASAPAACA